jgi:nucleoside-diphosphate-sugar epimerase
MDRKRILVTGGAGTVGSEALRELMKAEGYLEVSVLDLPGRRTRRALDPFGERLRFIPGSVDDAAAVDEAVRGADAVIHLAALIPPEADADPERTGRVNVWGTHLVIDAMKRLAPEAFLLYSSSVSVYGDRLKNPWISVDDPLRPAPGDIYGAGKVTAERLVRRSGLRYSVFRLTGVMSPASAARGRMDPLMFRMPLDTPFEMATSRDVGFAFSRAIHHEAELEGRTFNLAGGPACRITYRELLRRTFEAMGLDFGKIDESAFATRNFHCGFFADSGRLQDILHFQRDSAESYIAWIAESTPRWKRLLSGAVKSQIARFMLEKSDPLNALKQGNLMLIERYFGPGTPYSPMT